MGTYAVVSASDMQEDLLGLFEEYFGENESKYRCVFVFSFKTSSHTDTSATFHAAIEEIAERWHPEYKWPPVQIAMVCDEMEPIVAILKPGSIEFKDVSLN